MDKIDKLFDAIEHPERYDETEIADMLRDPEVREVFEVLDKTKSSLGNFPSPDVESEWKSFAEDHTSAVVMPRLSLTRVVTRNVAATVAIAIVSLTAAAVVGVSVWHRSPEALREAEETVTASEWILSSPDTVVATGDIHSDDPAPVIFDDEPLEAIIGRIAEHYGYSVSFRSDAAKSLRLYFRWNQSLSLDEVVGSLNNFEQINLTVNGNAIIID